MRYLHPNNNSNAYLTELHPGTVIGRKKDSFIHVGLIISYGKVLHNNPEKGEHLSSISDFSNNQEIMIISRSVLTEEIEKRIQSIINKPLAYSAAFNNCEDTVSRALTGKNRSPQRNTFFNSTAEAVATVAIIIAVVGAAGVVITRMLNDLKS
jgi:hypothetical protein